MVKVRMQRLADMSCADLALFCVVVMCFCLTYVRRMMAYVKINRRYPVPLRVRTTYLLTAVFLWEHHVKSVAEYCWD